MKNVYRTEKNIHIVNNDKINKGDVFIIKDNFYKLHYQIVIPIDERQTVKSYILSNDKNDLESN